MRVKKMSQLVRRRGGNEVGVVSAGRDYFGNYGNYFVFSWMKSERSCEMERLHSASLSADCRACVLGEWWKIVNIGKRGERGITQKMVVEKCVME